MTSLLYAVRRRLRLAWALATVQLVAPAVAAAALVLVLIGRVRPWSWPEPAAVAVAGAAMLTVVAAALAVRVPITVAARAADRGLATGDAFATALELERRHPPSPLADHVKARAVDLAAGRSASDAVPLRLRPRRLLVVGVLATCAVVLGLVANHQDDVRRRQAGEQRALAAEAARLAKAADELKKAAQSRGQEEVARQVQELARALAAANLQEGRAAVDKAARELASGLSPDLLAQKAAARGLDRTLAASPLPQTGNGDATSQLQALAGALSKLSPEERLALADRLAGLAATQTTGDPAAARALEQAAGALRAGDLGTAGAALNAAAAAQSATSTSVGDQEAALSAFSSLAATEAALSAAAAGQNQGGHQGQGGGQGQGAGAGQGSQGQGQGGGQGQAAGGGSGQAGGTGAPTGSGTGGAGTPNGTGNNASVGLQEATIFAPSAQGAPGPQLNANGQIGEGPTQATAGRATGPNTASGGQVPLASVLTQSQAQATQALDRLGLAPSQRALVQAYFAALAAAGS